MAGTTGPKRQDTRKFFENLSGAGKSIAVLTSGGDAQDKPATTALPLTEAPPPASVLPSTKASPPVSSSLHLGFTLLCHLLVFCPYFISTLLMVSLYRNTVKGSDPPSSPVRTPPTVADRGLDDDCDDVTTYYL